MTKGASYLMTFEVLDFSINEAPNKKKKDPAKYSSELNLQFKIIDVATSKILLNETILVSSKHPLDITKEYLDGVLSLEEADKKTKKTSKYDDSESAARENVFLTFESEFTPKLDNFFKPTYSVVDLEEVKSKIKSITINAGRNLLMMYY